MAFTPTEGKTEKLLCATFFALALVVAFWFRFYQIEIKPFHHDEGVNSYFLLNLARSGEYSYDPTNYHGPTLYYLALISLRLFGENDLALRFWPALFGTATVGLLWFLRRRLGPVGTPVAAFLMALSPGLVYFSRDFIHEMSFGCFSLGVVVGAWRYAETKKFAWLVLMSLSAGLLFATKETAIITAVVLILAIACASVWDLARRLIREKAFGVRAVAGALKNDAVGVLPSLDHTLAALIIFFFTNIFFYTSIFTDPSGLPDAVKSVFLWSQRSRSEHVKSFWFYLGVALKLELPLLIGSFLAGILVVWRGDRFRLFLAAWTLGITLAYSIIGYKTPWLMVNLLIPMSIVSGYAAQGIYQLLRSISLRTLWMAAIVVVMVFCGRLSWKLNFRDYDDNKNSSGYFTELGKKLKLKPFVDEQYGYAYAQTDRDILNMVQLIKELADRLPTGNHTGIYMASPDYWPLPWYLRDYDQVAYTGGFNDLPGQTPVILQPLIIAGRNQQTRLDGLPDRRLVGRAYVLRPGVDLVLYVREE
jgi:uncharacterized protein (TIGR03663 family)